MKPIAYMAGFGLVCIAIIAIVMWIPRTFEKAVEKSQLDAIPEGDFQLPNVVTHKLIYGFK